MTKIINIKDAAFYLKVKKGFKNWRNKFKGNFGPDTRLKDISTPIIAFLSKGKGESVFYIYDLIMNIRGLGSGLKFSTLDPNEKIFVIDQYLFLLDQIRFECMKRLGWLESYPAENYPLAVIIRDFENIVSFLQTKPPILSPKFPGYERYKSLSDFDKETFIRQLIPKALEKIMSYFSTL